MEGPIDEWRRLRDEILQRGFTKGFDPELGTFVQAYGAKFADASLLLMPASASCRSPTRAWTTIAAIEQRLLRNGFVMRYDTEETDDGLPPGEGAFLACSFWLVDVLIYAGPHGRR